MFRIEEEGEYKKFKYRVVLNKLGHRCGYVKIPQKHKYYDVHYRHIPLTCHGGLTYSRHEPENKGYWIGFDCAHYDDSPDMEALEKSGIWKDQPQMLELISLLAINGGEVRSKEYVIDQCKKIIDQL